MRACQFMVLCGGEGGGEYLSCGGDAAEVLVAEKNNAAQSFISFDFDVEARLPVFVELTLSRSDLHTRDNGGSKGTTYSSGGDATVPCASF